MVLTNYIRYFLVAFTGLITSSAHAGIMDFISEIQNDIQETLSIYEIEPYIIPLEQGRLVEEKNFIDKSYTEGLDVKNFVTNTKSKTKSMNDLLRYLRTPIAIKGVDLDDSFRNLVSETKKRGRPRKPVPEQTIVKRPAMVMTPRNLPLYASDGHSERFVAQP